ncbi:MAG: acyl-CoA dehydrogenase family protein, partial [Caldilineae bacterium]
MNLDLTPAQAEAWRAFAAYAQTHIAPRAEAFDREERLPGDVVAGLAQQGYLGATLPSRYGGAGMDMLTFGLLNEALGRACAATRALVMVQNMVGQALLQWGSEAQKSRWLPRLARGETIAAIAVTEPEVGSDA